MHRGLGLPSASQLLPGNRCPLPFYLPALSKVRGIFRRAAALLLHLIPASGAWQPAPSKWVKGRAPYKGGRHQRWEGGLAKEPRRNRRLQAGSARASCCSVLDGLASSPSRPPPLAAAESRQPADQQPLSSPSCISRRPEALPFLGRHDYSARPLLSTPQELNWKQVCAQKRTHRGTGRLISHDSILFYLQNR